MEDSFTETYHSEYDGAGSSCEIEEFVDDSEVGGGEAGPDRPGAAGSEVTGEHHDEEVTEISATEADEDERVTTKPAHPRQMRRMSAYVMYALQALGQEGGPEDFEEEEVIEEDEEAEESEVEVEEILDGDQDASVTCASSNPTNHCKAATSVPQREEDYDEQVVESIYDLKEDPKTPAEYDREIRKLIAIVYADDDVDGEAMIRRAPVKSELYSYLKQMYWYEKHTGKVGEIEDDDNDKGSEYEQDPEKKMSVMELFARRALLGEPSVPNQGSDNDAGEDSNQSSSSEISERWGAPPEETDEVATKDVAGTEMKRADDSGKTSDLASIIGNLLGQKYGEQSSGAAPSEMTRLAIQLLAQQLAANANAVGAANGDNKNASQTHYFCDGDCNSSVEPDDEDDDGDGAMIHKDERSQNQDARASHVDGKQCIDQDFDEQVVESIYDLKEEPKTADEYDREIRKLIAIVYAEEDVDAEAMIRRAPVKSELYSYLKQMFWYEKHTGKVEEVEEEDDDSEPEEAARSQSPERKTMSVMEIFARRALLGDAAVSDPHRNSDDEEEEEEEEEIEDEVDEESEAEEEAGEIEEPVEATPSSYRGDAAPALLQSRRMSAYAMFALQALGQSTAVTASNDDNGS